MWAYISSDRLFDCVCSLVVEKCEVEYGVDGSRTLKTPILSDIEISLIKGE